MITADAIPRITTTARISTSVNAVRDWRAYLRDIGDLRPRIRDAVPTASVDRRLIPPGRWLAALGGILAVILMVIGLNDLHLKVAALEDRDQAVKLRVGRLLLVEHRLTIRAGIGDLRLRRRQDSRTFQPLAGNDDQLQDEDDDEEVLFRLHIGTLSNSYLHGPDLTILLPPGHDLHALRDLVHVR